MNNTPWNYFVDSEIKPLISVEEFDLLTTNSFSSKDDEKLAKINGVSAAIRNYCGWHISPVMQCTYIGEGQGRILVLPAMAVRSVESLTVLGNQRDYEWRQSGLVRLKSGVFPDEWQSVVCEYEAGIENDSSLSEIVAQIVSNALAAAPGIAEEHAGGVGATYNKTGDGITGGVSLLDRDKEQLSMYRLFGV